MCKMKFYLWGFLSFLCVAVASQPMTPAVFLTPLIKSNKLDLARNISAVNPAYFLNTTSHSGFLTVDKKHGSNVFFWYFPVQGKPVQDTPWIVWLQGGPGASSIAGLFDEIGPFEYIDGQLKLRKISWTKAHSVVFIDNPVGAGFSFTNSEEGLARNMSMCSTHLYIVLQQLTTVFPDLKAAPLYLAGESYAGRYIPAFALKILDQDSESGPLDVNLQGVMMGNPVLRREAISNYTAIYQQWGIIDSQGALAVKPIQDAYNRAIAERNSWRAEDLRNQLLDKLSEIAMQQQIFNLLRDDLKNELKGFVEFIEKPATRSALHVGSIAFTFSNGTVHDRLRGDFISEPANEMSRLLDHYRVLIYCGQLDLTAPCVPNAQDRRKRWFWSQRDYFLKAPRTPWWFNNSVAGYVKSGGSLTEVLVRGAGHLVPADKPEQLHQLMDYFIRGLDMPYPQNYLVGVNDTPPYQPPEETPPQLTVTAQSDTGTKAAMFVSLFINVILILALVAGVVYSLRWRHRVQMFSYNNVEETSITEGVLSMS